MMNQLKMAVVGLALVFATTQFAQAQGKVAHINVQQLLSEMPEMIEANAELKKLQETYRADIESSYTELRNKFQQYQNEAAGKTAEENKKRAVEPRAGGVRVYRTGFDDAGDRRPDASEHTNDRNLPRTAKSKTEHPQHGGA